MLTLAVNKIRFGSLILLGVFLLGCSKSGRQGGHSFNDVSPEDEKNALQTTGLRNFNNHNYSVDGDSKRTQMSSQQLLNGKDSGNPELEELANNNISFAESIQSVVITRRNSKGEKTQKGRNRFQIKILSSWPESKLAPLEFQGPFIQDGDLLKIDETLSENHGDTFKLVGSFQDLDYAKKVYGTFHLKVFSPNGQLKAQSTIHTRSYQATTKVRTPNDMTPTSSLDYQIETLKNSKAWVTNTIVVLGRVFFDYDVISNSDRADGIEEPSKSVLKIEGESLVTSGFVTNPTEVKPSENSGVHPKEVSLFGADNQGLRSFEVNLENGGTTQDIMVEFQEDGEIDDSALDPSVRGTADPEPRELSASRSQQQSDIPITQETEGSAPPLISDHTEGVSENSKHQKSTESTHPQRGSDTIESDTDTSTPAKEEGTGFWAWVGSWFGSGENDSSSNNDSNSENGSSSDNDSGFFAWLGSWFGNSDEDTLEEVPDEELQLKSTDSTDDTDSRGAKELPKPSASPAKDTPNTQQLGKTRPEARPKQTESELAVKTSLRPRQRPTKNWPPVIDKPQRNSPDLKIQGINFGLSNDAFLPIHYKPNTRVAQGLHDMERHYGYKEIRDTWIPHMRDKRGSLIRNFWKHGYPVRGLITQVFEAYDVLPTLAYVTILESKFLRSGNFEIEVTGSKSSTAYGPFQLLRGTAKKLGLSIDSNQGKGKAPSSWDERNWFVPSLCGAAKHFAMSLEYYGHADTTWAILAYYAGDYGATQEIAKSLNVNAKSFWNKLSRYSYTYQEIKAYNKLTKKYEDYVDKKIASYFLLQSPSRMGFQLPTSIQKDIPNGHKHKFFPKGAIKDHQCEKAAQSWRAYFNRRLN